MVLTAIVRPYRESVYNVIDIVFFLVFIQICFSIAGFGLVLPGQSITFAATMFGIGLIIPLIYITLLAVNKILPNTCIIRIKDLALHRLCLQQSMFQRRDS